MIETKTKEDNKNISASKNSVQFMIINVGNALYAIDIMKIVEIIKYVPVTHVPKAPEFLEGVIDLRGSIIPVIDMRKRFEIISKTPQEKMRIVVVKVIDKIAGLIVDGVKEVLRVAPEKVLPPPKIVQGIESEYLSSVISNKGRIILVLNLDKILTTTEKVQFQNLVFKQKKQETGGKG
jgi:purine-binding chemotaxis protein CheW